MNLEIIENLSDHFQMVDKQIQRLENHKIEKLLRYFNLPEKGLNTISIEECLKWNNIGIYLPENIYKTINFTKLVLPKKVKFHSNKHDDNIYVFNEKRQSEWPYPALQDRKNFLIDMNKNFPKIDFPFYMQDLLK